MQDLGLILVVAGLVTILFKKIGQPVVLGYILAGFLVSPHVAWMPNVGDLAGIQVWAEIGVIFLLFALGLEFSFKKLAQVGGPASITAVVEVVAMTTLGYAVGQFFGWSSMDSLFLGGALAISSTTIIIRAFHEAKVKGRGFAQLVFGVLVVEDIVAILLLALLSTVAVSHQFDGYEMLFSVLKLFFFLTIWFLIGIFILPTWLKKIKKYADDETLLVVALALCFLMVILSAKVGFSAAFGAFIMGSLLAETTEAERVEHLVRPVKDLFAAIFFVSVGMLINLELLGKHIVPIIVISFVTIFGKFFFSLLGALLGGRSLKHSVQAGMSLAQIGEFSFIIASLGMSLKVTSDFLYPITVGVSALTTFTTPYMIRSADRVYELFDRYLPQNVKEMLARYATSSARAVVSDDWNKVFKSTVVIVITNCVLISAIFLIFSELLPQLLIDYKLSEDWTSGVALTIATVASAPFFWALLLGRTRKEEFKRLWLKKEFRKNIFVLVLFRSLVGIGLFGTLASRFVDVKFAAIATVIVTILFLTVFSRYLRMAYRWFEGRFIQNFSEKERAAQAEEPPLAPWDAHIVKLEVSANSDCIGKTLEELKVRENFGIILALIQRGRQTITAPARAERLYPGDRVSAIGTDEQIAKFKEYLNPSDVDAPALPTSYVLMPVQIKESMPFCNKPIRHSGIRELTNGLVVGVERRSERILNPDSSLVILPEDLLWIVGDISKIKNL